MRVSQGVHLGSIDRAAADTPEAVLGQGPGFVTDS